MALKKIRRTKPLLVPVAINYTTKTFVGFSVMTDDQNNVTITAHWLIPRDDGTMDRATTGVDAAPIRAITGFNAVVDAIVAAS